MKRKLNFIKWLIEECKSSRQAIEKAMIQDLVSDEELLCCVKKLLQSKNLDEGLCLKTLHEGIEGFRWEMCEDIKEFMKLCTGTDVGYLGGVPITYHHVYCKEICNALYLREQFLDKMLNNYLFKMNLVQTIWYSLIGVI